MTQEQKNALRDVIVILAAIIRDLGEIPSGHLYARLMDKMSLSTYQSLLGVMQKTGMIRVSGHVIYWTGPAKQ